MSSGTTSTGPCDDGVCRPNSVSSKDESNITKATTTTTDSLKSVTDSKNDDVKPTKVINIEIISDTMCPWCWVGKRNLEMALSNNPHIHANITWIPYFLDRYLPDEGIPVKEYFKMKYGDPNALEPMKPNLIRAGMKCNIDFGTYYNTHLDRYRPTILSHRLIEYAKEHCQQQNHQQQYKNLQHVMVEELFRMHFEQGKYFNCIEHLCEAAESVGLNKDTVKSFLESNEKENEVYDTANKYSILAQGVPTFLFSLPGEKSPFTFSGGQPPSAFQHVFDTLLEE